MSVETQLPSVLGCFHTRTISLHLSRIDLALTLLQGFPSAFRHCLTWLRIALWDSAMTATASKWVTVLIWCSEEEKCLISILPNEHIPQTLDTKTVKFTASWVNEWKGWGARSALLNCVKTVIQRYKTRLSILTSDPLVPVARQRTSRLFVPIAGSVVFSLQTNGSVSKQRLQSIQVWKQPKSQL